MRLSKHDVAEMNPPLKTWMSRMTAASKSAEPPVFTVKGPMSFVVRQRASAARMVASTATNYTFMGGEKFRLASVYQQPVARGDAIEIGVSLVPADLKFAKDITSATMTLDEASERFDGFDAWLASIPEVKDEIQPARRPVITKDENRESWGAW